MPLGFDLSGLEVLKTDFSSFFSGLLLPTRLGGMKDGTYFLDFLLLAPPPEGGAEPGTMVSPRTKAFAPLSSASKDATNSSYNAAASASALCFFSFSSSLCFWKGFFFRTTEKATPSFPIVAWRGLLQRL